jgi:carboxyl-terminal processing protease
MDAAENISVLEGLFVTESFFEYANIFCSKHNPPSDLKQFKLTEKDYSDFIAWLKSISFRYSSELEEQVKRLTTAAKDTRQNDEVVAVIQTLNTKIELAKQNDFTKFKAEIMAALEAEIGFHYGLQAGRFQVAINSDSELQKAIQVIADSPQYNKILLASHGLDSKP